ncbi:hypothetical protein TSUD_237480 [Trifolium subterraneum]|uniref:Enoyl reductase (ER) domain-containing protein n=1 Tax=Trifolium subterraneum TaxID=3900 RepID=A0A2Z6LUN2_TRISU|nr:hypothetical protein TSUD_237480 [Trifolium subterraneum]
MANTLSNENEVPAFGWAARDSSGILSPFHFSRRANGDLDITMKILYCGICHGDVHFAKNEIGRHIEYPMVPGHEIVGEVIKIGKNVKKFKIGDIAGIGPICGSCGTCSHCSKSWENSCPKRILTYNGHDYDGSTTYGGYSNKIVVNENYAIIIPKGLPLESAAPLLCAGLTVYSPMIHHGLCQSGQHLGIVGLGGLGHVAVKFAKAFNMKVTVISTSPGKKKEALERLGADSFLLINDEQQLQLYGKLILVGASITPPVLPYMPLMLGRKIIAGSAAGGMKESQDMINFAAKHNITADIEVISMDYVNTAFERLEKNDVKYRFVIDVANTLN